MELNILPPTKWASHFCLIVLAFILVCDITNANDDLDTTDRECNEKDSCHECIQTRSCGWCSKPDFKKERCFHSSLLAMKECPDEYFYSPENEDHVIQDKNLTESKHSNLSMSNPSKGETDSQHPEIVQIKPQSVHLKLRRKVKKSFKIFYKQAENYPVDLYYLMDLSDSMADDKEVLSGLGTKIVEAMKNLTTNFKIGFGSFVDKVAMPYMDLTTYSNPCGKLGKKCSHPYGYQNVMRLTNDTGSFETNVKNSANSGNLDSPEGGMDAIMQAVVCTDEIGWRKEARRVLVFSTDAPSHFAGDGKLAGIVKPNDGKCHLNATKEYSETVSMDYPSVSQINTAINDNNINVIFAVGVDVTNSYRNLSKLVDRSSWGQLSDDSSNVVDLIRDEYKKITSTVPITSTASDTLFRVKFFSKCGNEFILPMQVNECKGIKVGQLLELEAEVELLKCPENSTEWNQSFNILLDGIMLTVDVSMMCNCPCETKPEVNSPSCKSAGNLICGKCKCDDLHYGTNCQCDKEKSTSDAELSSQCQKSEKYPGGCSGRGVCTCGECECRKGYEGTNCEFDNDSCDRGYNGLICSGPNQGVCQRNECQCKSGYTGKNCACQNTTDSCIAPDDTGNITCSGNGDCVCGQCNCKTSEAGIRYSGDFCEKCNTCPTKCKEFKNCVVCRAHEKYTKISKPDCETVCSSKFNLKLPLVDKVSKDENTNDVYCSEKDEDSCDINFLYKVDKDKRYVVEAEKKPECLPPVDLFAILWKSIICILIVGVLLLMIWRILTTVHDRREYAKFLKERELAKWQAGENPIYKPSVSNFQNPTYDTCKMD